MIENLKEIQTVEEFCGMLNDDRPVAKGETIMLYLYAEGIKTGRLDKEHYTKLCLLAIPEALTLFPNYPLCVRFLWWIKNAGIFTEEIQASFIDLIKNKWTEEAYPKRINERGMVILEIATFPKRILSFDEVLAISEKTAKENPWWANRLLYEYDPEKSLENLQKMPKNNFVYKILIYIPTYLQTFSKEELKCKFEKIELPEKEKRELFKWLEIIGKTYGREGLV